MADLFVCFIIGHLSPDKEPQGGSQFLDLVTLLQSVGQGFSLTALSTNGFQ